MRNAGRNTDMRSVCRYLFKMERISELSKVISTFNGIGHAGEAKFLSYRSMMMDMTYGFLFVQWFQHKSLKTNPSGFVPEWEFPEMCMFLALGCYWAFCDGLYHPGGAKLPSTLEGCTNRFVYQDLHKMQDKNVANQITTAIKSAVPEQLKYYYIAKLLCYGVMTHLAWDPAMTYEEAVALGGWTPPFNSDYYMWVHWFP
jgi:hypothetical protein